jgi:hypothetical protein
MRNPNTNKLHSLISWLEGKDPNECFFYGSSSNCLLAQYYKTMGYRKVRMGGSQFTHHSYFMWAEVETLPRHFNEIAISSNTFGEALNFAREIAKTLPEYRHAL